MEITPDQVFNEKFVADNSYVDWAMQLDCQVAFRFLCHFYTNWPELLVTLDSGKLSGGLRAISYSCGIQWRIFNCGNATSLEEKKAVLDSGYRFFLDCLSQRDDLEDICFMWWDDLGIFLSTSEGDASDWERKELADKLLELLIGAVRVGNERAQLSAIHGLDCLGHPHTRQELGAVVSDGRLTSRVQGALNSLST